MKYLRIFEHILPKARAWRLAAGKQLTEFFEGLTELPQDVEDYVNEVYLDIFPSTTRELDAWDDQWGLPDTGLTTQQRRDRLDATWKAIGGQDPRYIQDTLQAAGFPVFVHEWWVPGTEPPLDTHACATPRNPLSFLEQPNAPQGFSAACGEPLALCGEQAAQAGEVYDAPLGYALVNKIFNTDKKFIPLCGELVAQCGELDAQCGMFDATVFQRKEYIIPSDPAKWAYFLYIGGEDFPTFAYVPLLRRDEFEDLCLKICPLQLWLGMRIEYTFTANRALLDGTDQTFTYPGGVTSAEEIISFEAFLRITGTGSGVRAIFQETQTTSGQPRIQFTLGIAGELSIGFREVDNGPFISTTSTYIIPSFQDVHVLAVINSGTNTFQIYVDAVLVHEDTSQTFGQIMTGAYFADSTLGGGFNMPGSNLRGELAFVGIYNTDKSPVVEELYRQNNATCYDGRTDTMKDGEVLFVELANWQDHEGQELVEHVGGLTITNNGSVPFTGRVQVACVDAPGAIIPPTIFTANTTHLDGIGQYFTANASGIDGSTWSLNIWAKRSATGANHGLFFESTTSGGAFARLDLAVLADNSISAGFRNTPVGAYQSIGSFGNVNDTDWHMITVAVEPGNQRVYLDGVDIGGNTIATTTLSLKGSLFVVGANQVTVGGSEDYFHGSITLPKKFDEYLAPADVTNLYRAGLPECFDDIDTDITDNCVYAPRLANWTGTVGEELDDQAGFITTNPVGGPTFDGATLNIECTS